MYFFNSEDEQKFDKTQQKKLYLADSLIGDIDKALKDNSKNNLPSIKSAVFDIVVLEKVLSRLGFASKLTGELQGIRNSLAHVDERMDNFDFQPVSISGFNSTYNKVGDKFKTSASINFQGAVDEAKVSVPVKGGSFSIKSTSLFGMIDDNFLWVDVSGKQRYTDIETMGKEYRKLLKLIKGELLNGKT